MRVESKPRMGDKIKKEERKKKRKNTVRESQKPPVTSTIRGKQAR
jgi:hypothetical protein